MSVTIEQQLNELVKQKAALATALNDKGIEAEDNETLNSLVEKVERLETKTNSLFKEIDYTTDSYTLYSTRIGQFAYSPLMCLKHIEVPEGVEYLNWMGNSSYNGCFFNCINLETLILPASLKGGITEACFLNCRRLHTIYFRGSEEQWNSISKTSGWSSPLPSGYQIIYNYTG